MMICEENNHGEIVHTEKRCPACFIIRELEQQKWDLTDQLDEALAAKETK